jgi:hypothetical protein
MHLDAAANERQRDATRADAQLERRGAVGQPGEEFDRGLDDFGREHLGRGLVVTVRDAPRERIVGHATVRLAAAERDAGASYPSRALKGVRYFFRNFTALAVREHLRSQLERTDSGAELTPNEVELVRFTAERSAQLTGLADRSPGK